ncbi:hypothetical protein ACF0H5_013348 [Mactra antiquata]
MANGYSCYICRRNFARRQTYSDIFEEKQANTLVKNSCHGNSEMFIPISRRGRENTILALLVLGILINTVHACDVDHCWVESNTAFTVLSQKPAADKSSESESIRCISLRTYMQCLVKLHGCKGNIRYHSVKKVVRNQMNSFQCNTSGDVYVGETITFLPPDELCTFHGTKKYKHCGLFGDPHIRTFDNRFQTCRVEGAWPLIDNDHLTVQVTNARVSDTTNATATTKLTVLIKKNGDCASTGYILYQANSHALPSMFEDGQTKYGKAHSVSLNEIDPGKHVEIVLKYIDTKIVIHLVGNYLTFSIRIPEELVPSNSTNSNSLELCVRGCPSREIIDYQKFLAFKEEQVQERDVNMSRKDAEELCRSAKLVDFYFDSCVFDLLITGNETFKMSAWSALQDVLKLDSEFVVKNRTSLQIYDDMYGSASRTLTSSHLVLVLLLTITTQLMDAILT